jgi:mono/diheme cytochrome c family protein
MVLAVVLFWIVVGLGVLLVALRRGPRALLDGARDTSRGDGLVWLIIVGVFAFGITVPTLVLANNGENHAASAPGGVHLNAAQQHGRYLFGLVCSSCHTLAASDAVAKVGPNLDLLRPPDALVLNAIAEGRARGNGDMPALLYQGADAKAVASYVAAVAGH